MVAGERCEERGCRLPDVGAAAEKGQTGFENRGRTKVLATVEFAGVPAIALRSIALACIIESSGTAGSLRGVRLRANSQPTLLGFRRGAETARKRVTGRVTVFQSRGARPAVLPPAAHRRLPLPATTVMSISLPPNAGQPTRSHEQPGGATGDLGQEPAHEQRLAAELGMEARAPSRQGTGRGHASPPTSPSPSSLQEDRRMQLATQLFNFLT